MSPLSTVTVASFLRELKSRCLQAFELVQIWHLPTLGEYIWLNWAGEWCWQKKIKMLRVMATCFSFLILSWSHTKATCDLSKSSEVSHTRDTDGSLHSFKQAAAKSYLSSLRQVHLSSLRDHLISAVALLSKQNEHNNLRKFYALHFFVLNLVDLVIEKKCVRQGAQGWCTGMTLRDGMGREGGSGWGTHVQPRLIHVNVWQKPLQYCKVISLRLK